MENLGISINQIILSVTLLSCGILTYYFIPKSYILGNIGLFSFLINLLLLLLIIGMIMISQLLVPMLERFILDVIIFFRKGDAKMKPIIKKNLESHGNRNLKTSLMFTVTLSFLVFSGTNFKQIQFFVVSLTKALAGADFTVSKLNIGAQFSGLALDEYKIKEFLDENLFSNGGII